MKKILALMAGIMCLMETTWATDHPEDNAEAVAESPSPNPMEAMGLKRIDMPGRRVAFVKDSADYATVYCDVTYRDSCHIRVNKEEMRLYVYEDRGDSSVLIAHYPVCVGLALGNKETDGDMKTPTCSTDDPFIITKIQDASYWKHDFGDGRGKILAYGDWFLRLDAHGHKGIGIHGSTNNEQTVPGRGSEGCIRLKDTDIRHLKNNYAFVGMRVIVSGE